MPVWLLWAESLPGLQRWKASLGFCEHPPNVECSGLRLVTLEFWSLLCSDLPTCHPLQSALLPLDPGLGCPAHALSCNPISPPPYRIPLLSADQVPSCFCPSFSWTWWPSSSSKSQKEVKGEWRNNTRLFLSKFSHLSHLLNWPVVETLSVGLFARRSQSSQEKHRNKSSVSGRVF